MDRQMYDPIADNLRSSTNAKTYRLILALEVWEHGQEVGTRVHAKAIATRMPAYGNFKSWDEHGMGKVSRILETHPEWRRSGAWFVKVGKDGPMDMSIAASVNEWIYECCPGRQSAQKHADAYNAWAKDKFTYQGIAYFSSMTARRIAPYLRAAGYVIVAKPGNRAVYARCA